MKYKIIKDTNPIMRKRSEPVELPLSNENKQILDEMLEHLKLSQDEEYSKKHNIRPGVGLAAIQIGMLKRMFVVYLKREDGSEFVHQLVNPRIIETSMRKAALEGGEGCLSVDKAHNGLVHRYYKVKIEAFDAYINENVVISATGYEAIVLQHEYDHLDGKFFYDHIDKNNPYKQLFNEELL